MKNLLKNFAGCGIIDFSAWVRPVAFTKNPGQNDFNLISAVETLGKDANGLHANLTVKEIPDEATDYTIIDYDGMESIFYVVNGKLYSM